MLARCVRTTHQNTTQASADPRLTDICQGACDQRDPTEGEVALTLHERETPITVGRRLLYDEKDLDDRLSRLCLRCSSCSSIIAGATNVVATGSAECPRTRATATDVHSAGGSAWRVNEGRQHHGHGLYFAQSPELGGGAVDARSCRNSRQSIR